MWGIFSFILRGFRWRSKEHELQIPSAPFPEFEFRPSVRFRQCIGVDVRFIVVNYLDLLLQEQGLMEDALVIEAIKPDGVGHVMWCRYDSKDLREKGVSTCTLFADSSECVFDGVCGTLFDRKKV